MAKFIYEIESSLVAGIIFWIIVSYLPGWRRRKKLRPKLELGMYEVYRGLFALFDCVMRCNIHSPSGFQKEIKGNKLRAEDIELGLQNKCLNGTFLYDSNVSKFLMVIGGELFKIAAEIDSATDRAFNFSSYLSTQEILLLEQIRGKLHVYDLKHFDNPAQVSIDGRPFAPVNPSLSYMKENLTQLYALFGQLQNVVFRNRYHDRDVLLDKVQSLCEQAKYRRCKRSIKIAEVRLPDDRPWLEFYRFLCQYRSGDRVAACRTLDGILKAKPHLVSSRGFLGDLLADSDICQVVERHYTHAEIKDLNSVVRQEATVHTNFIAQANNLKEYYHKKSAQV